MTALAGFWSFGDADGAAAGCERMLAAQRVYAPDPSVCRTDGPVAFGRRLFSLLPEDRFDRGPVTESGRMLVADVRLDNRDELCRALGLGGGESGSLSDAAIVMHCLERWDLQALDRMVGDFAFALWNAVSQKLILARDFLGQRPLHYHRGDGFFAFASMPKGLHALAQVPVVPNRQAAADFLALLPETGTETFFEGIERVQPGHYAIVTRDGVAMERYWNPRRRELGLASAEDHRQALREQMELAVTSRLRGTRGRVGAHLSGGLDSSAVAATAAGLLVPEGGRVTAFTAVPSEGHSGGPGNSIADEGPLAASVAALHANIEHVLVRTSGRSPLTALDRNFYLYERPLLNLCNAVWSDAILDSARERRLQVLLTGALGNMSFSYDGMQLLPQLLRRGRLLRLAGEIRQLLANGARIGTVASQTIGPYLPRPMWSAINRLRGKAMQISDYSAINPAAAESFDVESRAASRGLDLSYRPRADSFDTRLWVLRRVDGGNYHKGMLGGWGIDVRDPTADRRLVEHCLSVPDDQYLSAGIPRALARQAFADRVPQSVLRERRKGYQGADWYEGLGGARAELGDEVDRLADIPVTAEALDTERMAKLVEDWPSQGWNSDRNIASYRLALLRGVSTGHFLRKAAGSNR
jgi:asparagine synthase (glutamine-hydrolysing)